MRAALLEGIDTLEVVDDPEISASRRPLAEIGDACADMKAGRGLRTVLDVSA
jgi:hypothetical protein